MEKLTIGALAKAAEVSVETVRYYERRGLLEQPEKVTTGYRHYLDSDIERLRFVRRAKGLGFTLTEIADLLSRQGLVDTSGVADVAFVARNKLARIDAEIAVLAARRCQLRQLLRVCDHGDGERCVALRFDQLQPEE